MTLIGAITLIPNQMGASNYKKAALPKNPEVVAFEKAASKIERELGFRMDLDEETRAELAETIVKESIKHNLDPLFVLAVIEVESKFNPDAVSPTGARGLMQIIPSTFKEEARRMGLRYARMFDPLHNVRVGISYLGRLSKMFRHGDSVLLAYNQGPGTAIAVRKEEAVPSIEGEEYPPKVWAQYKRLLNKHGVDPRGMRKLYNKPFGSLLKV